MIGLMAAVEAYLAQDHAKMWHDWSDTVDRWLDAWIERAPVGVAVWRDELNEAGEPIPRVLLRFGEQSAWKRDRFVEALRDGDPGIEVVLYESAGVAFSPNLLQGDEAAQVARRVNDLLLGGPDGLSAHPAEDPAPTL
jgi:hypothetical protein